MQQRALNVLLALAVVIGLAASASADSVKVGGFWIDGVQIQDLREGKLVYVNNSGSEISKPMADIEGFKIEDLPQLTAANESISAGDYKKALSQLRAAARATKVRWLNTYIDFQTMMALDQTGEAYDAVQAYLNLARGRADEFYLSNPPMASISSTEDTKQLENTARRLEQTIPRLSGVAREQAVAMQQVVNNRLNAGGGDEPAAPEQPNPATPAQPATPATPATPRNNGGGLVPRTTTSNGGGPASAENAAVTMPNALYETHGNDPVTRLLADGKFEEALADSKQILSGPVKDVYTRLYQQGVAQLALAEAASSSAEKEKLYKDAGLSFVRILIYHPNGSLAPAALLEAAYVHEKIGENDVAAELYNQAALRIDEEQDPAMYARLQKLRTGG